MPTTNPVTPAVLSVMSRLRDLLPDTDKYHVGLREGGITLTVLNGQYTNRALEIESNGKVTGDLTLVGLLEASSQ